VTFHHLMPASPYTTRFLELLASHPAAFSSKEHVFWIEQAPGSTFHVARRGEFVPRAIGAWGFLRAFQGLRADDRIVIHQLSNPRLLAYLLVNLTRARRCAWSIWGGDVYYDVYRPKTWSHDLRERMRHAVIPRIPVISSMVPGDVEFVREKYGSRATYVEAFYPIPMDSRALVPGLDEVNAKTGVTILVGNSGDPLNHHAWVFEALARFRGDGIRVVVPLAYGDPTYVASVIARGREIFGDRFTPLTDFLPSEQYARLIREVDAAVMNHGFQQALGNIIALLLLGKKVYVRGDTTTFGYFQGLGVRIDDTRLVPQQSLAEIVSFTREDGVANSERVRAHLSEANAVAGWRKLFDTLRGAA